uniref:USP8 dimerisation domain-containing protein n=1 Tax=Percolomonas cosmopolitus TaxID=63605 RepID=A0A7S1KM37_9EUKA|mmetsp:Transcript_11283/g.42264  ORF Transcript_11283/g.42264 Transcript_11283/m.42264 type:complete len:405 (+) Transcript_11283:131-1345(+)
MICTSLQELNQLALTKLDEQIEKNGSLSHHFTLLKFTLQQAAKARSERDPEKTYLFLVMYMILVLRKIPAFDDELENNKRLQSEYMYNKGKVKKVKDEVERFRDYLQRMYEQDDDEENQDDNDEYNNDDDDDDEYHYQYEAEHDQDDHHPSPPRSAKRKTSTSSQNTRDSPSTRITHKIKPPKKVRPLPGLHSFLPSSPSLVSTPPTQHVRSTPMRASPQTTTLTSLSTTKETHTGIVSPSTQVLSRGMESLAMNENVQAQVGKRVGRVASDSVVQDRVGRGLSQVARNEQLQSSLGEALASSTENRVVQSLARNQKLQKNIGNAIHSTVTNKTAQKLAGTAISQAASNRELQKKAAKGLLSVGKGSLKAGVWSSKNAMKFGVKGAQLYMSQQQEQKSRKDSSE